MTRKRSGTALARGLTANGSPTKPTTLGPLGASRRFFVGNLRADTAASALPLTQTAQLWCRWACARDSSFAETPAPGVELSNSR